MASYIQINPKKLKRRLRNGEIQYGDIPAERLRPRQVRKMLRVVEGVLQEMEK